MTVYDVDMTPVMTFRLLECLRPGSCHGETSDGKGHQVWQEEEVTEAADAVVLRGGISFEDEAEVVTVSII